MISIVIPVKNGGDRLQGMLEAINQQEIDDEAEVVIVDSGSTDGTQALARSYGALVHEIPSSEFNHGATRNLGAEIATGEVIVFTVDDALPVGTEWLRRLVAPLHDDPEIAASYGRQIAHDDAPPYQAFYIDHRYGPEPRVQHAAGPDDLTVANVLFSNVSSAIRRTILEEHPFASDIVIAEDLEWCTRILLSGHQIAYVPTAVVRHSHTYSLGDTVKRYFDQGAAAERSFMSADRSSPQRVRSEGIEFVRRELRWMWRSGHRRRIPEALAHESARFAGFQLGAHHHRLPRALRVRISRTPVYWSR